MLWEENIILNDDYDFYRLSEIDNENQRVIAGSWQTGLIYSFDLNDGTRTQIVSDQDGKGIELETIYALSLDATNNRVLLIDATLDLLVWVNLSSGERTVLAGKGVGKGPHLSFMSDVELDVEGNRAFVIAADSLVVVDLTTGDRAIVSE